MRPRQYEATKAEVRRAERRRYPREGLTCDGCGWNRARELTPDCGQLVCARCKSKRGRR